MPNPKNLQSKVNEASGSQPIIVGIGASAGGLDALRRFVARIPKKSGMAFVVVQHLDPTHKSALAELLSHKTSVPVKEVEGGERVLEDHIYVIPPNRFLGISAGRFTLDSSNATRGVPMAIDSFFRSLAASAAERAVGIVLSGTGSDGTSGLREIKELGGLVMVQDPEEAAHDGMPSSAVQSGLVDLVLGVDGMVNKLLQYVEHSSLQGATSESEQESEDVQELGPILAVVKEKTELDFGKYRKKTVLRRIRRRMGLAQVKRFSDYLELLRKSYEEVEALGRDILINVTEFFRDPDAWRIIESEVLPALVKRASSTRPLRIWVPGCATGEEAYSFAMLLSEAMTYREEVPPIQIFATDIANKALDSAREGVYAEGCLSNVSDKRIRTFFVKEGSSYRISKTLREMIAFAPHNLLTQPPFSNMDLISCRNMLIYFEPEVQKRVFERFHFSLTEGGCLFLGSSESIGRSNVNFSPVSKQWRIFKRTGVRTRVLKEMDRSSVSAGVGVPASGVPARRTSSLTERVHSQFLAATGAALALVNADNKVTLLEGDLEAYFRMPAGELVPQLPDLLDICKGDLRAKVRSCLFRARQGETKLTWEGRFEKGASQEGYRISARPFKDQQEGSVSEYLVIFERIQIVESNLVPSDVETDATSAAIIRDLEHELSSTREQLNCTIEEFETANEELKASNEEAMSMNEELQSSNEELETSKEELQSLNEELNALNQQLESKLEELQDTTDDLNNLLGSTDIATLFLDTDFKLRRYTPRSCSYFHLSERNIGQPLAEISPIVDDPDLLADAKLVLEKLHQIERKVHMNAGAALIRRVSPYRTSDDRIAGVVITLDDVSSIEVVTKRLARRERQQAAVAEIGKRALATRNVQEILDTVVEVAKNVLGVEYAKVLELLPGGEELRLAAGVGWREGLVGNCIVNAKSGSQGGYTLRSSRPVIVEDLETETRFDCPPLLHDHQVKSGASVIIGEIGNEYGVLGVHSTREREFDEDDLDFLQGIANIVAEAVIRSRDHKAAEDNELKFRALADNIAQLAWTTDADGSINWYNRRWYEYTGTTFEEMKGWGWTKVHDPEHLERVEQKFRCHIETGEVWEDTFPLRSATGEYRWFLSRAMPIRDKDGKLLMWFGTNTDIEDLRKAEEALRRSDELKDQFLATLAHELRNPLAPISMGLDMLRGGELAEEERKEFYEILGRQTGQLVRLVDDLMDISRISRGKVTLQKSSVSVQELLLTAIEMVNPLLNERSHEIELEFGKEDLFIHADKTRVTQIFGNLLSNAARYTEERGKIKVSLSSVGDQVLVSFADNGIGISGDMLTHIFNMFTQGSGDGGRSGSGLGIGLTLVKSLVEMHGGSVEARSEGLGKGSEFRILLPRVAPPAEALRLQRAKNGRGHGSKKVMVVDDNKVAADVTAKYLEHFGHEVLVAYSGQSALEKGGGFQPDVVLMDIGMPEMDGVETARRVRKEGWGEKTLLVATTGWGQEKDRKLTKEAGFNEHLVKPIDPPVLNAILDRV
ncbi:CheR family methyltransferase [Pelagicoccus sp. SDUM812005]|uniref:CheR family methyltransferase n=1 Tax=Pelagicoccus sp. SDUM812005 TaxID=3041257 RepID=UPI00280E301C|nr:CheR family methyltransferase [Pelagicoccus sp. SDUM812005]MDQ8180693.1 CheR family methyltransferase [Pelagicoccus sp. SDUM812005]